MDWSWGGRFIYGVDFPHNSDLYRKADRCNQQDNKLVPGWGQPGSDDSAVGDWPTFFSGRSGQFYGCYSRHLDSGVWFYARPTGSALLGENSLNHLPLLMDNGHKEFQTFPYSIETRKSISFQVALHPL